MASPTMKAFRELEKRVEALEQDQGIYQNAKDVPEAAQVDPVEEAEPVGTLVDVYGTDYAILLHDAGYRSVSAVKAASDEDLLAISGIGKATLNKIRAA